jgi:alanyl-tRNA synthetase
MTINDIRSKYLAYLQARGHAIVPSSSLVPQNDPTTLFTGSGMQPMVPYLLGAPHPLGTRIADSQKSFRAADIEEIGDNRHTCFFEMLGNWSLGDYWKEEQLSWIFAFLVEEVGLDPHNLYVTAFSGDEKAGIPRDDESAHIWQKLFASKGIEAHIVEVGSEADGSRLGMRGGRIFFYDASKNWWSRAGTPDKMPAGEPGGPDSEMFYDFGTPHDVAYGAECHPNCDCGRFLEIGNSVFMQFLKQPDGSFAQLPKRNVDFGGGAERIAAAAQNNPDVFSTDVFAGIIALLEQFSGKSYTDTRYQKSFRIVADHMRGATFLIADGVRPSNTDRGYVLRRLLRRASLHAQKIGVAPDEGSDSMLNRCATIVIEKYEGAYPELATEEMHKEITETIWKEEVQFGRALADGTKEFERAAATGAISGEAAFTLFTTHGFPFELTQEMAHERGITVDGGDFAARMKAHQDLSRAGGEQKFKGGLADASEETTRLHTAHHLLLKALQIVLGPHVKQRGSNITKERLRIDFSHGAKMTPEQKAEVERIVNEKIAEDIPMTRSTLPIAEAEKLNAEHEFGAKYPDVVSVYSLGPTGATEEHPQFDKAFSIEFCGGPHVTHTGELAKSGVFKITAEEASSAGVRRIKAVLK